MDLCKCVCHDHPEHFKLQDALEALQFHQQFNRELLDALKAIESCLAPEDNDIVAQKVRAAITRG